MSRSGAVKAVVVTPSKPKLVLKSTAKPEAPKIPPSQIREQEKEARLARAAAAREMLTDQETCLRNLPNLKKFCKVQEVTLPNGNTREWPVVSVTALAEALDTSAVTTNRWRNSGMLPEPILKAGRGNHYHLEEVRSFVVILGTLFKSTRHYRDEATRLELFKDNARIRDGLLKQAV